MADRAHPPSGRIALSPTAIRWISDSEDNVADQCAHGDVILVIDSIPFAAGREARDVTVSAAALFLLRTLAHDHTPAAPVAEDSQLFPHCGHAVYPSEERFPVLVLGCNDGIDLEVVHSEGTVTIRAQDGTEATVTETEWRDAVVGFVDEVQRFYDESPPRKPLGDDAEDQGWEAFWREWRERRRVA